MQNVLDRCVLAGNRIRVLGRRYPPFVLFLDLGVALCVPLGIIYSLFIAPGFPVWRFIAVFFVSYFAYNYGYLNFKRLWQKSQARSYIQDLLFFLMPTIFLGCYFSGVPIAAALDLGGLVLALFLCVNRIGCFLGGCCYGYPSPRGVLYPAIAFQKGNTLRTFTPSEDPGARVFPLQLVDSAFNGLAFVVLLFAAIKLGRPTGALLPGYFLLYSVYRFFSDFWRWESCRPRVGRLSEAQVLCVVIGIVSGASLAVLTVVGG